MEVHHHPQLHHEKKPWKEYFLEFLMIFLAVSMGFFAETMRENISENGKAKELAKSLYQEIYKDSIAMHDKLVLRDQKDEQMLYFMRYLKDSSLTHLSDRFYPSFTWTYMITAGVTFDPNDGVLNQLRNSGTLRYFKSIELQNAISNINTAIFKVRDRNAHEYTFNEEYLRPFVLKYFDFTWYDAYTKNGKVSITDAIKQTSFHPATPAQIRNMADLKSGDAIALAAYYMLILRSTKQAIYPAYVAANHTLLQQLRKEYNLKNE